MSLGIRLTWKRSNDDTVEYGIWRRTYDTEAHEIARIAQTAAGENPFFEDMDVDIKPPIGPDGLTIECPTDSTVCLKWAEAADPANPTYYYSIRSYTADGGHSPSVPRYHFSRQMLSITTSGLYSMKPMETWLHRE